MKRLAVSILHGDCRETLDTLTEKSVQTCVTSPPYWGGLRDYDHEDQNGLERNPSDYVDNMIEVFRHVRRVLKDDGTLWLNVGDVYAASGKGGGGNRSDRKAWESVAERKGFRMPPPGYKMKDLTLVAFALADALRRDGWYLRSTIIWRKPSAVEPMRIDRPAVSHEYVFLLSKSKKYLASRPSAADTWWGHTVWDIRADGLGFHPASMPLELARRCILAGSRVGDIVLDPFSGAGTTGVVAVEHSRRAVLCELNTEYIAIAESRIRNASLSNLSSPVEEAA